MGKSEVYSWRVSAELKSALEEAARAEHTTVSKLLERIVGEWVERADGDGNQAAIQKRLHGAADRTLGTIRGGDPHRAEQIRDRVRKRLKSRRAS